MMLAEEVQICTHMSCKLVLLNVTKLTLVSAR